MSQSEIKKAFKEKFNHEPILVRAPGRINFIGEHTDYNNGLVLPAAIDREIYIALSPNQSEECRAVSLDLNEQATFDLKNLKAGKGWVHYLQGVLHGIHQIGFPLKGVDVIISGNIPLGAGLSSSAALCCGFAMAYSQAFNLELSRLAIAKIAQYAEHNFAGVKCGLMDQYATLFGKKDFAVLLDCQSLTHEWVPFQFPELEVLLIDTKVKHSLADSAYNNRREACELGVALLMRKYPIQSLRDVSEEMLLDLKSDFPDEVFQRCLYVVQEINRTKQASKFLKEKNLKAFGELLFQTHNGLSKQYEVSCVEADLLVELAKENNLLGARMMGGGFGGCTINLIHKEKAKSFIELVREKYFKAFQKEPEFHSVSISNGVEVLN